MGTSNGVDKQTIEKNITRVIKTTDFKNLGQKKEGKGRDG